MGQIILMQGSVSSLVLERNLYSSNASFLLSSKTLRDMTEYPRDVLLMEWSNL